MTVNHRTTVMSSKIIPLILCTKNVLVKQDPTITIAKNLKIKLIEKLEFRCESYEQGTILSICTLLDPRFKNMHFNDPIVNVRVKKKNFKNDG